MHNSYLTMDYYIAISFIIVHMGYNKYIQNQASVLQGCISVLKKCYQMKDEKLYFLYTN